MAVRPDYQKIREESIKGMKLDEKSYKLRLSQCANKPAVTGKWSGTLKEGDVFELPIATPENYSGELPQAFILSNYMGNDFVYVLCNKLDGSEYRIAGGRFSREPRKKGSDGKAVWNAEKREYETYPLEGSFFTLYRFYAKTEKYLMPTLYKCAAWLESNRCCVKVGAPHEVETPYQKEMIYPMEIISDGKPLTDSDVIKLLA